MYPLLRLYWGNSPGGLTFRHPLFPRTPPLAQLGLFCACLVAHAMLCQHLRRGLVDSFKHGSRDPVLRDALQSAETCAAPYVDRSIVVNGTVVPTRVGGLLPIIMKASRNQRLRSRGLAARFCNFLPCCAPALCHMCNCLCDCIAVSTLRTPWPCSESYERPSACGGDDVLPYPLFYVCVRPTHQGYGAFNCNPADLVYAGYKYDTESYVLEIATFVLAIMVCFVSCSDFV